MLTLLITGLDKGARFLANDRIVIVRNICDIYVCQVRPWIA